MSPTRIVLVNLPSPPGFNIMRGVAGGFGRFHSRSLRTDYGHDIGIYFTPPLMEAYAAAVAENLGAEVGIIDGQVENLGLTKLIRRINGYDSTIKDGLYIS